MGHYLSEMLDPSPIDKRTRLEDDLSLKKGKEIMRDHGYWRKGDKCYLVTHHEIPYDGREWYEIHCESTKKNMYFISVSAKEWNGFEVRH